MFRLAKRILIVLKKREAADEAVPDEDLIKLPIIEEPKHEEKGGTPTVTGVANVHRNTS